MLYLTHAHTTHLLAQNGPILEGWYSMVFESPLGRLSFLQAVVWTTKIMQKQQGTRLLSTAAVAKAQIGWNCLETCRQWRSVHCVCWKLRQFPWWFFSYGLQNVRQGAKLANCNFNLPLEHQKKGHGAKAQACLVPVLGISCLQQLTLHNSWVTWGKPSDIDLQKTNVHSNKYFHQAPSIGFPSRNWQSPPQQLFITL